MSTATSHRAGMRAFDWLVLGGCLWILTSVAFAHEAMRRNPPSRSQHRRRWPVVAVHATPRPGSPTPC